METKKGGRNRADKNVWKNNNNNKNNNISEKETQNSNTSPNCVQGDVITRIAIAKQ
jgi:hypothetical protein